MILVKPILIPLLVLAVAGPCKAQIDTLTPVEQGTSDVEPIATSIRVQPIDARIPFGYEVLYQGTWSDPLIGEREIFARRSGALTAVFPRSSYVRTKEGIYPEIPAGTIFYFGDVKPDDRPAQGSAIDDIEGRRDLRADSGIPPEQLGWAQSQPTPILNANQSIWSNESYRQIRVSRLLGAASRAEQSDKSADENPNS